MVVSPLFTTANAIECTSYRGRPLTGYGDTDPLPRSQYRYAESPDGITFPIGRNRTSAPLAGSDNNVILADAGYGTYNFAALTTGRACRRRSDSKPWGQQPVGTDRLRSRRRHSF